MKIVKTYSHLNGLEFLLVHKPKLWKEIQKVIKSVDAKSCKTKKSKEKTKKGRMLYSPKEMNKAFDKEFSKHGWKSQRPATWVTGNEKVISKIISLPPDEQKQKILDHGETPIRSYNQTDFVKDRVAVEVQFGKYSFVAHDLFVKHMAFYVGDLIDLGVEILPMKEMEREMSSGVPYFERDLFNVLRQGRSIPAVPLILIGVAP